MGAAKKEHKGRFVIGERVAAKPHGRSCKLAPPLFAPPTFTKVPFQPKMNVHWKRNWRPNISIVWPTLCNIDIRNIVGSVSMKKHHQHQPQATILRRHKKKLKDQLTRSDSLKMRLLSRIDTLDQKIDQSITYGSPPTFDTITYSTESGIGARRSHRLLVFSVDVFRSLWLNGRILRCISGAVGPRMNLSSFRFGQ